jgi:hypothetical protein
MSAEFPGLPEPQTIEMPMSNPDHTDEELSALAGIIEELDGLDLKTTKRILWYLNERFVVDVEKKNAATEPAQ